MPVFNVLRFDSCFSFFDFLPTQSLVVENVHFHEIMCLLFALVESFASPKKPVCKLSSLAQSVLSEGMVPLATLLPF